MRVKLDERDHYLVSDAYSYWIVKECQNKNGETYDRRLSGYFSDIQGCFKGFAEQELRNCDAKTWSGVIRKVNELKKMIENWTRVTEITK